MRMVERLELLLLFWFVSHLRMDLIRSLAFSLGHVLALSFAWEMGCVLGHGRPRALAQIWAIALHMAGIATRPTCGNGQRLPLSLGLRGWA